MRDRPYERLTEKEKLQAARMSLYFPAIKRGHGSQHCFEFDANGERVSGDPGTCVANRACNPFEPNHRQDRLGAAAEFILWSR